MPSMFIINLFNKVKKSSKNRVNKPGGLITGERRLKVAEKYHLTLSNSGVLYFHIFVVP